MSTLASTLSSSTSSTLSSSALSSIYLSTGGTSLYTNNTIINPWITTTAPYYNSSSSYWYVNDSANPLQNLFYNLEFSEDKDDILRNNIKSIKKKKIYFNCSYIGNRIQPYEYLMRLINDEVKMIVKVKVSDILTICYNNFQFVEIENNLNFNSSCDFSVIKVKFKYDNILYENHKLSKKELRTDKLKKIIRDNENSNS